MAHQFQSLLRRTTVASLTAIALMAASAPASAADAVSPEVGAVDAFQGLFGKHPGFRLNHAKGIVLDATFTPSPEAAGLSKAAIFAGAPTKVTVRFSDPGGDPGVKDNDPEATPHGLALRFTLADKSEMDIAMISTKTFPVGSAADFRDLLLAIGATKADSPKPSPIEAFLGAHPAALFWVQHLPAIPASLATETYYGLNAYRFINKAGTVTNVRYRFVPVSGETHLAKEDLAAKSPTFLMDEIQTRAKAGNAKFKFVAQVGAKDDKTNDVTINWPDDRALVTLGELAITGVVADSAAAEKAIVFMPSQVVDGIEASDDPMINSRSAAYAESFGRRQ